ncbi:MAG TPA: HlyD family efflux transporter periplasmic adaptor subunit [Xanthobacteraceae bacterium]|nr:HlyD family efflux transporter periplasmic adaptor subunit [Xanthobacteraceae bacterium]
MQIHDACKLLFTALLVTFISHSVAAHEGHDHGGAKSAMAIPALPRADATSQDFELVAIAAAGELTLYLDRFATNEPVSDAVITVETPKGSVEAKPSADGTYRLAAPWTATPGRYDLIASVVKNGTADVLSLSLDVPSAGSAAFSSTSGDGSQLSSIAARIASIGFSGAIALIAAFIGGALGATLLVRRRHATATIAVVGLASIFLMHAALAHEGDDHGKTPLPQGGATRDVAQMLPDGSVFIPKRTQRILAIRTTVTEPATYRRTVELPGRIIPDPDASGFVQAAIGGRLSPPEGGFPRLGTRVKKGDVLAYVTAPLAAIDVSDMRQRQGELDQQISIVERRLARYETLAPSGSVARSQLEDTRLELEGLRDRRSSLDKVRREPEALIAPVDGIVADGTPVAGQIAQSNAMVFHIIDPSRLWVEALSYEALPAPKNATAQAGDKQLKLSFRGAGFADRNQSIPIHFAVEGDVSGLRAGQFITVHAETPEEQQGLAVPRSSVVRTSTGQESVYEHVSAERFEQRPVRVEPLDGQRVLISQGLAPGKRVVVQGAELIDHIR